jgi:hypothetical protein
MKLNPHLHVVFLDGALREHGEHDADFHGLGHLQTREVAGVLEQSCKRIAKWLRRRGLLQADGEDATDATDAGRSRV